MKRYLSPVLLALVGSMSAMVDFDINIIDGEKKCMKPIVGDLVILFNREGAASMTMDLVVAHVACLASKEFSYISDKTISISGGLY